MANQIDGDLVVTGNITFNGTLSGNVNRSTLIVEPNTIVGLPLSEFRQYASATQAFLASTGSGSDCGLVLGAFGTALPYIASKDLTSAGATTQYARIQFVLPPEYVTGNPVYIRVYGGMVTLTASVSATVDLECYKAAKTSTLISGTDLVSTAATTINFIPFTAVTFTLTPTTLVPGDLLDLRLALITNHAPATACHAAVSAVDLLLTTRG